MKAYKNLDFLNSHTHGARKIRVLCELTEPEQRFAEENIEDTIVLFGSARIRPPAEAQAQLEALQSEFAGRELTREEQAALHRAEALCRSARYYDEAVELSRRLTRWSIELPDHRRRFIICSGGGPGIMEAANRGAKAAGGASIGLGISLPFEQGLNPYVTPDLAFEFHYFFVRKYWFLYPARALIVFPGGFGTLDELFEVLTLVQTGKASQPMPIVLYGREFWEEVINFEALVRWGTISPGDLELFQICDDVESAHQFITERLSHAHLPHLRRRPSLAD